MERGSGGNRRRSQFKLAAVLLFALSATACTAASVSPSALVTASASASSSGTTASSPTAPSSSNSATPTDTPVPTDTPYVEPTPVPTPPLPTGPLPGLGSTPSGVWTGIEWIAVPGGHSPAVPAPSVDADGVNASIEGWSKGYVEFLWNPHLRTLVPEGSADGLLWHAGAEIDTSAFAADFKAFDKKYFAPGDHDACWFSVIEFEQGPTSLLLRGDFSCRGGCGGPWYTSSDAMWVSSDGLSWTRLDISKTFGGDIGHISGGSNGYIALGRGSPSKVLWVSPDGLTWSRGALPAAALKSGSWASDPASFAGGYVLPGVILEKKGDLPVGGYGGGCVSSGPQITNPPSYLGALWWSADGKTWVQDSLSGTKAAAQVQMTVARIDDHTLLASQTTSAGSRTDSAETDWISTDGKTWTAVDGFAGLYGAFLTHGTRGVIRGCPGVDPSQGITFCVVGAKLNLVALKQTGDVPWIDSWQVALGPTGLLVTADGSRFWIGVPTAG